MKKNWRKETDALTEFEITESIRFANMGDRPDYNGCIVPNYRILQMVNNKFALKTIMDLRRKVRHLTAGERK